MRPVRDLAPSGPDWRVDWDAAVAAVPAVAALAACPQDPAWHAEGDVGTHTRMVCEAMAANDAYRAMGEAGRAVAFAAALLHDVGKPATTVVEADGRITSRGHSRRGAVDARLLLDAEGWGFTERESVARLIAVHQWPFTAMDRADPVALVRVLSQELRLDLLCLLAESDARGRECAVEAERQRTIDYVELFRAQALEEGCLDRPWPFVDDRTRVLYAADVAETGAPRRPADFATHGFRDRDGAYDVCVMSGLPGSGKDRWVARHRPGLPMIGFDAKRAEMDVSHDDNQGAVSQAVAAEARAMLNPARRAPFVWNATNVSRQLRQKCLGLMHAYGARVEVVYVESARDWNAARPDATRVPDADMRRMRLRWEPPTPNEAHRVSYVVDDVPQPDPSVFDVGSPEPTPAPRR